MFKKSKGYKQELKDHILKYELNNYIFDEVGVSSHSWGNSSTAIGISYWGEKNTISYYGAKPSSFYYYSTTSKDDIVDDNGESKLVWLL